MQNDSMKWFATENSFWIWSSKTDLRNADSIGECVLFRRAFSIADKLRKMQIAVSADSQYRLSCNGRIVGRGPIRGTIRKQFYDIYDITGFLHAGNNELICEVVSYAGDFPDFVRGGAPMGRMTARGAFVLEGAISYLDGSLEWLRSDEQWQCAPHPCLSFCACPGVPCAGPGEVWQSSSLTSATIWQDVQILAVAYREDTVWNSLLPYRLYPNPLPWPNHARHDFIKCEGPLTAQQNKILKQKKTLSLRGNEQISITLDYGEELTARLHLNASGKCQIQLVYSENLTDGDQRHFDLDRPHAPPAGSMHDEINFTQDAGEWESFDWRAFRFATLTILAKTECSLVILPAETEEYAYPFQGKFTCSDESLNNIWDISQRTLRCCSHDLFEDCPYYERMQYPADSHVASFGAWLLGGDTILARHCLETTRESIGPEGLCAGSYPSRSPVYLPIWSLHYICNLEDYYQYSGDREFVLRHRTAIYQILEWFKSHLQEDFILGALPYWCVADFSKGWNWKGEPPETCRKPSAYPLLKFIHACLFAGRFFQDDTYLNLARQMTESARRVFYNSQKQLWADTQDHTSFSMLTQAEAAFCDLADEGLLKRAMAEPEVIAPALFGKFWAFSAAMKLQDTQSAQALLRQWSDLAVSGRTTWPEGTPVPRSECHVWSSLPLIALPVLFSGFRILSPGCKKIYLAPKLKNGLHWQTTLTLPSGLLTLSADAQSCRIALPNGVTALLPDGQNYTGEFTFS